MLRLCGAELVEVPALPYGNPEQLPAHRPPPRRPAAQDREERRPVRRPVEQPRQPQGALRLDRPGNLGADRRQDRRLHLRDRHRRHPRRRFDLSARKKETSSSASPIRTARRCTTCSPTARPRRPRRLDHRRHRPWPRHADHRRHQGRQALSDPRRGGGAAHLRSARARGPVPGRLDRHQRRRRDPARQGHGPGPHHRHHSLRTTERAISRSCSIRSSCARSSFRCRNGSNGVEPEECRTNQA